MIYRAFFAVVLSRVDAEQAHTLGVAALAWLGRWRWIRALVAQVVGRPDPSLAVQAFGLTFPSPLGIAAGLDKEARAFSGLHALGFGCVEVGTVTAQPQVGNPRPRVFRVPSRHALVNRMGFPNPGVEVVVRRLAKRPPGYIVGANIGKTKVAVDAVADYRTSAIAVAPHCDYLVINVSSPNTPGLRDLQAVGPLRALLTSVQAALSEVGHADLPLLVKIAPDLADDDILAVADLAVEIGLAGIVATNTTIDPKIVSDVSAVAGQALVGGVSGPPVSERAVAVLRLLHARVGTRLVLISAGGVESAEDVLVRLQAGATLVQAYTAVVYAGPLWARRINHRLLAAGCL